MLDCVSNFTSYSFNYLILIRKATRLLTIYLLINNYVNDVVYIVSTIKKVGTYLGIKLDLKIPFLNV